MKKYSYLFFILVLSLSFVGCNAKLRTTISQTQGNVDAQSVAAVDSNKVVQEFLKQKNLKTVVNSVAMENIQLPIDFKVVKDNVKVGDLLRQRNQLSKQNGLEFSKYMGQKVKIYATGIDTGETKSNYEIVLFIAGNKVVGYWVDGGMKDPKQNRADFNVLVNILR